MIIIRKCGSCGKVLPLTIKFFHKRKDCLDGFRKQCKKCRNARDIRWLTDRSGQQKRNKAYRASNQEKIKELKSEWNRKNKERNCRISKIWAANNREHLNEYQRQFREIPARKLADNHRRRINGMIAKLKVLKISNSVGLLGCSMKDLKIHLESQFQKGMSWDNYGKNGWEVDHIIPCSKFDLSREDDQRKCFHFSNLQPMWMSQNRAKGNRLST